MTNAQKIGLGIGLVLVALFVRFSCSGDGTSHPPLGFVNGKVTLDGNPLTGLIVAFYPDKGRMGTAIVDAQGNYEMNYTNKIKGTVIRPSKVHFSWQTGKSGPRIPQKFDPKEGLPVEVKTGRNVIDFAMESDPTQPEQPIVTPTPVEGEGAPFVD